MTGQQKDIILLQHYNDQTKEQFDRLVDAVRKMRIAQGDFVRYRGEAFRKKMVERQKVVDKIIREQMEQRERQHNSLFSQK